MVTPNILWHSDVDFIQFKKSSMFKKFQFKNNWIEMKKNATKCDLMNEIRGNFGKIPIALKMKANSIVAVAINN